jgi:hypothetical protein
MKQKSTASVAPKKYLPAQCDDTGFHFTEVESQQNDIMNNGNAVQPGIC